MKKLSGLNKFILAFLTVGWVGYIYIAWPIVVLVLDLVAEKRLPISAALSMAVLPTVLLLICTTIWLSNIFGRPRKTPLSDLMWEWQTSYKLLLNRADMLKKLAKKNCKYYKRTNNSCCIRKGNDTCSIPHCPLGNQKEEKG